MPYREKGKRRQIERECERNGESNGNRRGIKKGNAIDKDKWTDETDKTCKVHVSENACKTTRAWNVEKTCNGMAKINGTVRESWDMRIANRIGRKRKRHRRRAVAMDCKGPGVIS